MTLLSHEKPYVSWGFQNVYKKRSSQVSLLNTSNRNKFEEFNPKDIEMLVDSKEEPWFKQAHIGTFWRLVYIHRLTAKLADEYQKSRDNFPTITGTLYVIVNSRENINNTLKEHIL